MANKPSGFTYKNNLKPILKLSFQSSILSQDITIPTSIKIGVYLIGIYFGYF